MSLLCAITPSSSPAPPDRSHPAYMLAKVVAKVGLPPGVCNLVFGLGPSVGSAIASDPRVPLISFTGGPVTGRKYVHIHSMFLLGGI